MKWWVKENRLAECVRGRAIFADFQTNKRCAKRARRRRFSTLFVKSKRV